MPARLVSLWVLLVLVFVAQRPGAALECSQFDPKNITLVTFDVFAALMDLYTSLNRNVHELCSTFMTQEQADNFVRHWVSGYGSYSGHVFTEAETGGLEPFVYVTRTNLQHTIVSFNLEERIPQDGMLFDKLASAWGNLIPWPETGEVLQRIAQKFSVAPLSNGNRLTLEDATNQFTRSEGEARGLHSIMSYIFSSNFPVGSFKPDARMYQQVVAQVPSVLNALHVAGAPEDGRGAREFGMFSALLHNPPLPGAQPCFLLANITLLPSVLGLDD